MSTSMQGPGCAQGNILELCAERPEGVTQEDIKARWPSLNVADIGEAINGLLSTHRLEILTSSGGTFVFRANTAADAQKFKNLNKEELLVFQNIQATSNTGAWTRDLKNRTNLTQPQLTKILKNLETRKLIKSVKTVGAAATKKVWMDADLQPAKEITGGSWYTEHELDAEFISTLRRACTGFVSRYPDCTVSEIAEFLKEKQISQVVLGEEDIAQILDTLVLDNAVTRFEFGRDGEHTFRSAPASSKVTSTVLTDMPCGVCPVTSECTLDGVISPATCEYYTQWLDSF